MRANVRSSFLLLLVSILLVSCSHSVKAASPRPLTKSELLALVSGGIIPDNVVMEIRADGLAFVPDDELGSLLSAAGADPKILDAVKSARTSSPVKDTPEQKQLLAALSRAGSQIKANQLDEATATLSASLPNGAGKNELGFVAGMVLINEERFDEAGQLYSEIAARDADFPQVHTRLGLAYYNTGYPNEALREAKIEIARNPKNPVAHMNAGLALRAMHNLQAAKTEIETAIQSNPNYMLAYQNLSLVLSDLHDDAGALAVDKKLVALQPNDANSHYGLGVSYYNQGDYVAAIREYREAKRLDPSRLDVRQNLGASLLHTDPAAAVVEFRELLKVAPDFDVCRFCLGNALAAVGNKREAEQEYLIAVEKDPSSPRPHDGLGHLHEADGDLAGALAEYRKAEQLDPNFVHAIADSGRVLLAQKKYADAAKELERAETAEPGNWEHHDFRGNALESAGQQDAAIGEYNEALTLGPKEIRARLDLAKALEKKSDWPGALNNYRRAALDEPPLKAGMNPQFFGSPRLYELAKERFAKHLAELRASGKAAQASALEAKVESSSSAPDGNDKFHLLMLASKSAVEQRQFDSAAASAKEAVAIAEKIQPQDGRMAEALEQLGNVYAWQMQLKPAVDTYNRQLVAAQSVYGAKSPVVAGALQNLAMASLAQRDFTGAENYFNRAVEINISLYGENSTPAADSLRGLAHVYMVQRDFAKSETTLLRVKKIYETTYGAQNQQMAIPLTVLCSVYDQWNKQDKAAACHSQLAALSQK